MCLLFCTVWIATGGGINSGETLMPTKPNPTDPSTSEIHLQDDRDGTIIRVYIQLLLQRQNMRFGYVGDSFGCGMWVEYDHDHDGGMWWSKCLKHDGKEHEGGVGVCGWSIRDGMWYVIFSKSVGKSSWALGRDYWVEHDHKGRSGMCGCSMM
ncbi:hypothetical protein DPMN_139898 [Dreissena polymorpha]|uniref:Uncharacterized protein n=1 Tax=Dreissena polymorpha TaxID=45954 RepID=A0A9D4JJV8_DREPO|nr:hypothetical protein DPMN_139898 [Dreissena polymorpha]